MPLGLGEIAEAWKTEIGGPDVFDVVNAYDAIGLIEWQPRTPRPGSEVPEKPSGLLQRLRKSFKKS